MSLKAILSNAAFNLGGARRIRPVLGKRHVPYDLYILRRVSLDSWLGEPTQAVTRILASRASLPSSKICGQVLYDYPGPFGSWMDASIRLGLDDALQLALGLAYVLES